MAGEELRVVGAGVGRTGTLSLKVALERLLGGRCYHMAEVFAHPEHTPVWHEATRGKLPDWHELLRGYRASVDWPGAAFWPELTQAFPDALVLLSVRDAESWWQSAHATIFPGMDRASVEWRAMASALFEARFTAQLEDREACIAAFERHNAAVRAAIPRSRLLEWRAGDGWAPLCEALGVPVPDEPFPHTNSTEQWLARMRASR
jgi:hypothetical protein